MWGCGGFVSLTLFSSMYVIYGRCVSLIASYVIRVVCFVCWGVMGVCGVFVWVVFRSMFILRHLRRCLFASDTVTQKNPPHDTTTHEKPLRNFF